MFDPKNPDVIYASAYQRRRAVGQMIGGGPEGGIFKTTNGGRNWTKLTRGLPAGDVGRAGLAIDPRKSSTIFALVDAKRPESGFFRSDDGGNTWTRIGRQRPWPDAADSVTTPAAPPEPCKALPRPEPATITGECSTPLLAEIQRQPSLPAKAGSHASRRLAGAEGQATAAIEKTPPRLKTKRNSRSSRAAAAAVRPRTTTAIAAAARSITTRFSPTRIAPTRSGR